MRAYPWSCLAAWLTMAIPWLTIDAGGLDPRLDSVASLGSVFAQFLLTSALLRREGMHHAWGKPGRVATYVVQGVVTVLCLMAGALLLIVPAIYLYARWLVVLPLVIGEGLGVRGALRTSWHRMGPWIGPAMVAVAAIFAPAALLCLGVLSFFGLDAPLPLWPVLASDIVIPTCMVGSWVLAVAAHLLLAPPDPAAGAGAATDAPYMPPASPA
ncbi:hypothetical protein [Sphingomonas pokkalii]|nr:hypothetical protein [Sphingomonas pokkalii]